MQGLILAAGMGKRLGKYTQDATKCMVPVNGKTLIEYAIESLLEADIHKLIIVIGYKGEKLISFLDGKYPEMEIKYIDNPIYDKTNNIYSLFLGTEELVKDDTILLESDLIFESSIIKEIVAHKDPNLAVVSHFESWMDGTVTLIDENRNISGLLGKSSFHWSNKESYYKTVNIYKFSKEFSENFYVPFLSAYRKAYGENEYYEQVLKVISFLDSTNLKAYPISGDRWYEIDDAQDLSIAENRFSTGKTKLDKMQKRFGGYWRFPNMLDFCYLVNPYFPPKSLVNELKSNFETLLTEYPSGQNEQCLLASKIFGINQDNAVVGNGAAELISAIAADTTGNVLIPYPTFNEYPERFEKHGGSSRIIKMETNKEDFRYTTDDILTNIAKNKAQGKEIKYVLLINPDNPTGNFLDYNSVTNLLKELKKQNVTLIFDESFIDFAQQEKRYTLLSDSELVKHDNLIVIKSISKSYGVPGLRLGILATSNTDLIKQIRKEISIWNINSFAEYYLQIYDKYKKTYAEACNLIAQERTRFMTELSKIKGMTVYSSEANYILCKLPNSTNATELTAKLLDNYNILIKDLSTKTGFQHGQFIRLAVRNTEDNTKLTKALLQNIN